MSGIKKTVGWALVVSPFVAIFIAMSLALSIAHAAFTFLGAGVFVALVCIGVWLTED